MTRQPMTNRGRIGDMYWHVHHDQLAEVLTRPIENRIDYINTRKPESERSTRLRWMPPVQAIDDPAWADLRRASVDLNPAWDRAGVSLRHDPSDIERVWADLALAWADAIQASADAVQASANLEPLHAIEHPGCPWDGRTLVFPKVNP